MPRGRIAYLNVVHNKTTHDEGNGWIFSYTETGQQQQLHNHRQ